ncbi:MAG: hypothetical protein KDI16_09525 [Halioglobus sp.]|nr:hypothetical protein [Halioglobus sp.]
MLFCAACRVRVLAVLCLLLASGGAAAGPRAYGETFVRVGHDWADAGSTLAPPPSQPLPEGDSQYRAQVSELEQRGGPYADALAEPLAAWARYYQHTGDAARAQRLYLRALHVVRINDGLYSQRQLPILRALLDGYRASGDLDALDERYAYYFHLFGGGEPPFTAARLRAALDYLRWQREALRLELDSDDTRRLLELYQLNARILALLEENTEVGDNWYREFALSQLRNLYLIDDRVQPRIEQLGLAPSTPVLGSDWSNEDFHRKRLEDIQRDSLQRGADLLRDALQRVEPGEPRERARLQLQLADWYQWHGSVALADSHYAQVVATLSAAGEENLVQQWLGQPRELPDNGAFWQPRPLQPGQRRVVVQASFDVSRRGRVRNVRTTVSDAQDEAVAARLRRRLARVRFSPSYESGQAQPVAQLQRAYELID